MRTHYKNATHKNKKLNKVFEIEDDKEEFNIPEGAIVDLSASKVQSYDLYYIKYADEFQSFVDISIIALLIYTTTEIYYSFFKPTDEINLSVVWCTMALLYGVSNLGSLAINYLRTEEASLLYVFTCLSFVLSLIVQLVDTRVFDFRLIDAFRNVSVNAANLIQAHVNLGLNITDSTIKQDIGQATSMYSQLKSFSTNDLFFTIFIALISGLIGGLLFFPSFRLARLHVLCIKASSDSRLKRFIYYSNFILPLAVSFCWMKVDTNRQIPIKPTENILFNEQNNDAAHQFLNMISPKSTASKHINVYKFIYNLFVDSNLKVYLILLIFVLRLSLFREYAQAYLNLAYELASDLRKSTTRITNVRYMNTISSIYQYYGVVASQYVVPLFILLFLVLLLKTLGNN